jgi:hypothetical protein
MIPSSKITAWQRTIAIIGAIFLCSLSGCYEHVTHGNESTYHFAWWLGILVIAGGLAVMPLGWLLRKWVWRAGMTVMCMGPFLIVLIAPSMFTDHVTVDNKHFEARYGIWFTPSVIDVQFADLQKIRYVPVRDSNDKIKYELHCMKRAGGDTVLPIGDLVKFTLPELLEKAKAAGVEIVDETR